MTWWGALIIGFTITGMAGVIAHPDGPERGFLTEWLIFGTLVSIPFLISAAVSG